MSSVTDNLATYASTGNAVGSTFTSADGALQAAGVTNFTHVFFGITFTDNDGVAATPGAGTFTLAAELLNNPGVFQSIASPASATSVDATAALQTYNFAGHATRVRVTPAGITTATKFNVYVSGSKN